MWGKHRFMNAFIRKRNFSLALSRLAASNDKDLLAHCLLPTQTAYNWPNDRLVNTFSRRLFSDSTEVCVTPIHFYPFRFFFISLSFSNPWIFDIFRPNVEINHSFLSNIHFAHPNLPPSCLIRFSWDDTANTWPTQKSKVCVLWYKRCTEVSRKYFVSILFVFTFSKTSI